MRSMDAVVMAGGIPREGEPLFELTEGRSKALLPVAGKVMVQWVLDALSAAQGVGRVVVVGPEGGLVYPRGLHYVPNHGEYLDNVLAGVRRIRELNPWARHLLIISADIPAVTAQHIDWVIAQAEERDEDFYYCVIDRQAMEASFPGCRRTFFRLRDREVCGGDLAVVRTSVFDTEAGVWQRLSEARKSRWRMAAAIGPSVLLRFLLGRLSVEQAERLASRRLGIRGKALNCPYPEVGMDVDKPFQLDLVEEALRRRGAA
jgi:GTP:adenosylcobinamide-phosphate guanylyltransferase